MIDAHDQATATIPGIPELPPRTTQAERRITMRYCDAKAAPSCRNCRYSQLHIVNPDQSNEYQIVRCSVGEFPVQWGGWCPEFAA